MTRFINLMKFFLVVDVVFFLFLIFNKSQDDGDVIFNDIVDFCIRIYMVIVLDSLYDKIKQENNNKMTFNNPLSVQVEQTPTPNAQYNPQASPYIDYGKNEKIKT